MIDLQTTVSIDRPIEEVYRYVSDPSNLPSWNSAVQDVRPTSSESNRPGARYAMERRLPTGRATNQLEIVARDLPREFAIRTIAGPTPFLYRYRFARERGTTIIQLDAQVELGGVTAALPQLARRAVKNGVDANLATLKRILEAQPRASNPARLRKD
jgi:uncharacterized protein YndB with AHSA1/START domain